VGLIAAKASGNPDATARFLARVRAKGPRFASPADFPNLMLSALAGHAAIYHGLRGPTLATTQRRAGGAAAACTAFDLLLGGEPGPILAAAVEEWGMAARLSARDSDCAHRALQRAEGASCVVFAAVDERASEIAVAVLTHAVSCHHDRVAEHLRALGAVSPGARVIGCGGALLCWLQGSAWERAAWLSIDDSVGERDDAPLIALLAAASAIAARDCDDALVVAHAFGSVTLLRLARP
jgi:3-oxoacyl-[acyl-carrier-protein] synthase II